MTHTPGPWRIQDDCKTSIWAGGHYIAETYTDGDENARLIAAAPDMLAALKRATQGKVRGRFPNSAGMVVSEEEFDAMLAAIAKATGETDG